jgi:hypothetical protein
MAQDIGHTTSSWQGNSSPQAAVGISSLAQNSPLKAVLCFIEGFTGTRKSDHHIISRPEYKTLR